MCLICCLNPLTCYLHIQINKSNSYTISLSWFTASQVLQKLGPHQKNASASFLSHADFVFLSVVTAKGNETTHAHPANFPVCEFKCQKIQVECHSFLHGLLDLFFFIYLFYKKSQIFSTEVQSHECHTVPTVDLCSSVVARTHH